MKHFQWFAWITCQDDGAEFICFIIPTKWLQLAGMHFFLGEGSGVCIQVSCMERKASKKRNKLCVHSSRLHGEEGVQKKKQACSQGCLCQILHGFHVSNSLVSREIYLQRLVRHEVWPLAKNIDLQDWFLVNLSQKCSNYWEKSWRSQIASSNSDQVIVDWPQSPRA